MSQPHRVLLTDGVANVRPLLGSIRAADSEGALELWASAPGGRLNRLRGSGARLLREPSPAQGGQAFLRWLRRVCADHRIDLVIPGRRREWASHLKTELAERGTRLMVAAGSPAMLAFLERKDEVYQDLRSDPQVPIPSALGFGDGPSFERAWRALRPRHRQLCIKPRQGIFGLGFAVLRPPGGTLRPEHVEGAPVLSVTTLRAGLRVGRPRRPQLLMQYLEGRERSVDCVAWGGKLRLAVSRRKHVGFQVLETEGPAIQVARHLTDRYRLDGLFNVQLKDSGGRPYLLEVNPRMSGGLVYTSASGVNLAYWAIMLHLGLRRPEDVPVPQGGVIVPTPEALALLTRSVA